MSKADTAQVLAAVVVAVIVAGLRIRGRTDTVADVDLTYEVASSPDLAASRVTSYRHA